MKRYTTLDPPPNLTMTDSTYEFLVESLIEEINSHPNKDELIELMFDQIQDDMTTTYLD